MTEHHQIMIEVQDLTQTTPESDLAAIVYYHPLDRYIEVYKDGQVRLISAAGVVNAHFKDVEKQDLLRQSYIQMLLQSGIKGEELEQALAAISRVDRRLSEETDPTVNSANLEQQTQAQLRIWAESQGLDYDTLSENEWFEQVQQGVTQMRKQSIT
jgi:hypothetical protein